MESLQGNFRHCLQPHTEAVAWCKSLKVPHSLVWLNRNIPPDASTNESRLLSHLTDRYALQTGISELFGDFPAHHAPESLFWQRDSLGKPFVAWGGEIQQWAEAVELEASHIHISNTHDGDAHILLVAHSPNLVGVGIDVLHLPRLQTSSKDRAYLLRLARSFMASFEWESLQRFLGESDEVLRVRIAAHFSLMEAMSKACGTGLRLGLGMGREQALPKRSLGVRELEPKVTLGWEGEGKARLETLGVSHTEAYWGTDGEYVVSVVLLWKA